jgi:hypothetical protein
MADYILLDEWHLSFRIPNDRDDAACDAIGRILDSRQFTPCSAKEAGPLKQDYGGPALPGIACPWNLVSGATLIEVGTDHRLADPEPLPCVPYTRPPEPLFVDDPEEDGESPMAGAPEEPT